MRNAATPGTIARAGFWFALAFALNLLWEISHLGLYTIWKEADALRIAWAVFHCTVGDAAIALALFAVIAVVLWRADWPRSHPWSGGIVFVIGVITFTAWSEWYNVYRSGVWGYTARMPMVFGIGLTPLLQWLILPPVMVVAYRALEPMLFGQQKPHIRFELTT